MLLALLLATQVPPPAETPARVIVCGRSATLVEVVVAAVGEQVPETCSGSIANTPGMTWYVSQHYALKTDHDEATARRFLEYSELAYPLQLEIIGRAPPEQDRLRMPLVMGSSEARMLDAIAGDLGFRPASIGGGGITYWGHKIAYNYPSGSLQYHQRDLVLHENLHLLHMCAGGVRGPHRLTEGITHTSCNHVYEEAAGRLTLCVFDKPTINMPTSEQLRRIAQHPRTFRQACEDPECITLFTSFLWSDPARLLGWREWRDALLFGGRLDQDLEVMQEVFGSLHGDIEQQWQAWLAERHATFVFRDWGWEQDGDTLVAYGWPQRGPYSRTDVLLPPGEAPRFEPLAMDWPLQQLAARELVGVVARGIDEPVIGAVLDFSRTPGRGEVGIGLGVEPQRPTAELAYLPVLLRGEASLQLRCTDLGGEDLDVALPEELRAAAAADGHRFGLAVRIGRERLQVTVRARAPGAEAMVAFETSIAIDAAQRQRLLTRPLTLLAKDGRQAITPCFDDARRAGPDLSQPGPANRWYFAGFARLEGLYRARRLLGDAAPASLRASERELLAAVTAAPEVQQRVEREVAACAAVVRAEVAALAVDAALRQQALDWLDRR